MYNRNLQKFFLSIVIPTILAISLFIVATYVIIIPSFEQNMMDRKKEMISELTNTAWSLLDEYNNEFERGNISLQEAKINASLRVKELRYGAEQKDYYWIIDMQPLMIMHPYREDLNGKDLSEYKDPNGKRLFVESVNVVEKVGEGYINYFWQWKDDSTHIVPKLSYVKEYQPWGWIVGTGIYLEDVRQEIKQLKQRLLKISTIITLFIALTLSYIVRQSLRIEKGRNNAEQKLMQSRQKYKSLVEASTEGTLMIVDNKIVFSNLTFQRISGFEDNELHTLQFDDLYTTPLSELSPMFNQPQKSVSLETKLKCKTGIEKDIVISVSQVNQLHKNGFIVVNRDITPTKQMTIEAEQLSGELQMVLLLMNQSIKSFVKGLVKCESILPVADVALLMSRKQKQIVAITIQDKIIGVISNNDLKNRLLAKELPYNTSASEIMSAPVCSVKENTLLFEALLQMIKEKISHLLVKNDSGEIIGEVSKKDLLEAQHNQISFLLKEIETAEDVIQLKQYYQRVPILIEFLLESSDNIENITRVITSVSDAITVRVIELAIEMFGNPPCNFAFIALGSEGRMEQTLTTDQDNAIVFENIGNDNLETTQKYFQGLGELVNKNLDTIGYKLCKGGNMAGNSKWSQPLLAWKEYFAGWIQNSDPQSILDASIFFDFRCLFGKESVVEELREHVYQSMSNKAVFFHHMAASLLKFKPPLSMFGNIVGDQTEDEHKHVDIKKVLLPVTGILRIYALQNNVVETNSLQRLNKLAQLKVLTKEMYAELTLLYNYLMRLRLKSQAKDIRNNDRPNNMLDVNSLTKIELATLRKIFSEINNLETKLSFDFKAAV